MQKFNPFYYYYLIKLLIVLTFDIVVCLSNIFFLLLFYAAGVSTTMTLSTATTPGTTPRKSTPYMKPKTTTPAVTHRDQKTKSTVKSIVVDTTSAPRWTSVFISTTSQGTSLNTSKDNSTVDISLDSASQRKLFFRI